MPAPCLGCRGYLDYNYRAGTTPPALCFHQWVPLPCFPLEIQSLFTFPQAHPFDFTLFRPTLLHLQVPVSWSL